MTQDRPENQDNPPQINSDPDQLDQTPVELTLPDDRGSQAELTAESDQVTEQFIDLDAPFLGQALDLPSSQTADSSTDPMHPDTELAQDQPHDPIQDAAAQPDRTSDPKTSETDDSSPPKDEERVGLAATMHLEQVHFQALDDRLLLLLPPESTPDSTNPDANWYETWVQFKQRLQAGERFWQAGTPVHLVAQDRLLDARQLQEIADALTEVQLQLQRVETRRRQTAVAAATAGYSVDQGGTLATGHLSSQPQLAKPFAEPLCLHTTLRSGAEIRHPGTVIVLADVNPGSSVIAYGDILIWGRLRGVAHAGANGNASCRIMALQMEPTQLRIASFVARAPENPPSQYFPEVAHVVQGSIRITKATEFARLQLEALTNPDNL